MTNNFFNIFTKSENCTITDIITPYKLEMDRALFCKYKTSCLYQKILKRCYAKSTGLKNDIARSLFDSVELGDAQYGVITLLANAMTGKKELFLINDSGIIRKANTNEEEQIKKDYADKGQSNIGVYVNFIKYTLTDLIMLYMNMIYDVMQSGKVNLGLARALQVKVADLRKTISVNTSESPTEQARVISDGLKDGKGVLIDAGDTIQTTDLQTAPVVDALKIIFNLLASELGVATSFVAGELASGMAVTGEADINANEDGVKDFFISVFKPVIDKLYNVNIEFKTDNWRKISQFANVIPYIESSDIITEEQKQKFINFIFEEA